MPDKLIIKDAVLGDGLAAIKAATEDFKSAKDEGAAAAEVCGHENLARALRNAANSWEVRRGKLVAAMEGLADAMQSSIDAFGDVDRRIADGLSGGQDQSSKADPGAGSSVGPTGPGKQAPGNGGSSNGQTAEAPVQLAATTHSVPPIASDSGDPTVGASGPAAAGQGSVGQHQQPSVGYPTSISSDPSAGASAVPSLGDAGGTTPSPVDGRTAPPEAQLLQTVATLWTRWAALGGSKEAMAAALTALGLGGMLAKLGLSKPAGAGTTGAGTSGSGASGPGDSAEGVTPPVDGTTGPGADAADLQSSGQLPAPIAGGDGVDGGLGSDQGDAVAVPGGPATAGQTALDTPAVEPIEGDLAAASAPQTQSQGAASVDTSSLVVAPSGSGSGSAVPTAADLPPLIQADPGSADAHVERSTSLPSLDAGSVGSVGAGDASGVRGAQMGQSSMMPSLALGGMAAMGGSRPAAAPAANLPNLAPGVMPGGMTGEAHKDPRGLHSHDVRKILDDLGNRDGEAEEQ